MFLYNKDLRIILDNYSDRSFGIVNTFLTDGTLCYELEFEDADTNYSVEHKTIYLEYATASKIVVIEL